MCRLEILLSVAVILHLDIVIDSVPSIEVIECTGLWTATWSESHPPLRNCARCLRASRSHRVHANVRRTYHVFTKMEHHARNRDAHEAEPGAINDEQEQ